jgi:hypothetical protein
MIALALLALIVVLAMISARIGDESAAGMERLLAGPAVPWVLGVVSALTLWWSWGSLNPVEVIHDETAYLLQAAMLAHGHLTGPPRPLPEFFEQFQVFASPVLAAKYPPGFALALVPGIWLGLPGLIPVVLVGISGGLIFALSRRVSRPATGLLTWIVWLGAPGSIPFRELIMSETLTTALWLAGWWCLLEWRSQRSAKWLIGAAGVSAWCVITRPLTGAAFAAVALSVVLWNVVRERRTNGLAPAALVAAAVLAILPWQNRAVTGVWTESAWSHYTAVYAPSDHFGFGSDSSPPRRSLPPDFLDYIWYYGEFHKNFTPERTPTLFAERTTQVLHDAWGEALPAAAILAGLGLASAGATAGVAAFTGLLLLLLHLGFAHPPEWSIYYEEVIPILALLSAAGAARVVSLLIARIRRTPAPAGVTTAANPAVLALSALLLCALPFHLAAARQNYLLLSDYHRKFRSRVAALPGRPLVFVRYARNHIFHRSLISNPPDLSTAKAWIVYDMGPQDTRLLAITPGRVPFIFFEHGDSLRAWTPADTLTWP